MPKKVTIRKYGGDDRYSWAVFVEGQSEPVVAGLLREEARSHQRQVSRMLERREKK